MSVRMRSRSAKDARAPTQRIPSPTVVTSGRGSRACLIAFFLIPFEGVKTFRV